jgi:hypothetical protein
MKPTIKKSKPTIRNKQQQEAWDELGRQNKAGLKPTIKKPNGVITPPEDAPRTWNTLTHWLTKGEHGGELARHNGSIYVFIGETKMVGIQLPGREKFRQAWNYGELRRHCDSNIAKKIEDANDYMMTEPVEYPRKPSIASQHMQAASKVWPKTGKRKPTIKRTT